MVTLAVMLPKLQIPARLLLMLLLLPLALGLTSAEEVESDPMPI